MAQNCGPSMDFGGYCLGMPPMPFPSHREASHGRKITEHLPMIEQIQIEPTVTISPSSTPCCLSTPSFTIMEMPSRHHPRHLCHLLSLEKSPEPAFTSSPLLITSRTDHHHWFSSSIPSHRTSSPTSHLPTMVATISCCCLPCH